MNDTGATKYGLVGTQEGMIGMSPNGVWGTCKSRLLLFEFDTNGISLRTSPQKKHTKYEPNITACIVEDVRSTWPVAKSKRGAGVFFFFFFFFF